MPIGKWQITLKNSYTAQRQVAEYNNTEQHELNIEGAVMHVSLLLSSMMHEI